MSIKIGWAGICVALLVLVACEVPLESSDEPEHPYGPVSVSIRIVQENSPARTVLPDTSVSVANYQLWGTLAGAEAVQLASFTGASATVSIAQGTWNFTLKAFNSSNEQVLQGELSEQLVGVGFSTLAFSLSPLPISGGGTGAVSITISLPPIPHITKADVYIGNELLQTVNATENSIVYTDSAKAAGNYLIGFDLKDASDTVLARISELVRVRANLSSAKTITVLLADLQAPSSVASFTATPNSASTVSLRWPSIEGASSYQIYQAESAAGPYTSIGTANGTSEFVSHTCSSLSEATVYYFKIYALNSSGQAFDHSLPVSALTYPGVPTGVQASETSGAVELSWNTVTGATGYRVYRAENSATGTYEQVFFTEATSYAELGLTSGVSYYYKVSAYNASGEGEKSTPVSFFGAPTGLSATAASSSSITLSWNTLSRATRYHIERSPSVGGTYTEVTSTSSGTSGTSYTDTGLSSGTTYYYKVRGYASSLGYGDYSTPVSATTPASAISNITYSSVSGGTWALQNDGRRKSPSIGSSSVTKARISFTSNGASITIQLSVSSEGGYDYAFISTLDNASATYTSGYYSGSRISGTQSVTVTIPVPTAGSHFIDIGYQKDGSVNSGSDCAWFKVIE